MRLEFVGNVIAAPIAVNTSAAFLPAPSDAASPAPFLIVFVLVESKVEAKVAWQIWFVYPLESAEFHLGDHHTCHMAFSAGC